MDTTDALARWHEVAASGDPGLLPAVIAEKCVFRSPAVHTPQHGHDLVVAYLGAAFAVLGQDLSYQREWLGPDSAVLEFTSEVSGRAVHGIDMITWDEAGLIVDFTVMLRPLSGLHVVIDAMGHRLSATSGG